MSLSGKQRFSANSFSGFGSRKMALSSAGGSSMRSSFGSRMGIGVGGGGASLGFGKGFGDGGGGGFRMSSSSHMAGLGSGMSTGGGGSGMFGGGGGGGGGGFGYGGSVEDTSLGFAGNEKQHMHNLNDRLATYMEKVRQLEATNHQLEEKLKTFTFNKVEAHDLTIYDATLKPLMEQLMAFLIQNTQIAVEIDNAKLTADDFRVKWENELSLRQCVEGDIGGLRNLQREFEMNITAMMQDLQGYQNERVSMAKSHEEELLSMRGGMTGQVNVDVQAAKSQDLSLMLAEVRSEYEAAVEKNRRQAEAWYMKQVEMKQAESAVVMETTTTTTSEMTELRNRYQTLQMEYQGLPNLEARLLEVQSQFQQRLSGYSGKVMGLEGELTSIRASTTEQSQDYQILLNIKSRLEMEIQQYKHLLEGAGLGGGMVVSGGAGRSAGKTC
ncbi:keratin, type I cytoskeletal 13-like [Salvelinus namaycush]|uniref:Keratin, type I cytoskeletal 13-like n=1 Tax=Salvelinus namaycush TaxID=8040 RepID=A0A8U0TPR9_SALNM|nr:keratin, type I cytoskeletal 13-like [Salvelinus namaycush]